MKFPPLEVPFIKDFLNNFRDQYVTPHLFQVFFVSQHSFQVFLAYSSVSAIYMSWIRDLASGCTDLIQSIGCLALTKGDLFQLSFKGTQVSP